MRIVQKTLSRTRRAASSRPVPPRVPAWSRRNRNRAATAPRGGGGFTLIEVLVVIAIISLLASILFPVFAKARESGRRSACLSNQRQVGMAILLYAQDNEELFPNGLNRNGATRIWPVEGWAGQCAAYIRNPRLLACLSDDTSARATNASDQVVSYAMNSGLVGYADSDAPIPPGIALGSLSAPARTVLLFEVAGVTANSADPFEGAGPRGTVGTNFSAAGNGLDNRLYAQRDWSTSTSNTYATGYMGGRLPFNPQATQFPRAQGRHAPGSNFVLADGHAVFLRGRTVSSGRRAAAEGCNQDNKPTTPGCSGAFTAAGTRNGAFSATFSIR